MLPQLIQETLDFYRWRIQAKRLHDGYRRRVTAGTKNVYWYNLRGGDWKICRIVSTALYVTSIRRFVNKRSLIGPLPPRYYYSSGLNHPTAYKNYQ